MSTKQQAASWLSNHGLGVSGTKQDLINRVRLYERYPKLVETLKNKLKDKPFVCSLDEKSIPPMTAPWKADDDLLPLVTQQMFEQYAAQKRQGSLGQQEKANRMLQSRKITTVKTLNDGSSTYVRAIVKHSFSSSERPAVVLFVDLVPIKGYCLCPVGPSGICCHILALLLFLKHYAESGEKLLELTCTQQLQKWHKRCRKGSIPMLPLSQIKVKSAKLRKVTKIKEKYSKHRQPAKRDVPQLEKEIKKKIREAPISVMDHFYSFLSQSDIGRASSFGEHISFNSSSSFSSFKFFFTNK